MKDEERKLRRKREDGGRRERMEEVDPLAAEGGGPSFHPAIFP